MMTAGRPAPARPWLIALAVFAAFMHLLAYVMVGALRRARRVPTSRRCSCVTGSAMLSWSLMLSQAMELVTRAFYARADLDLILSSPVTVRRVFAVRIAAIALSTVSTWRCSLAGPFIDVLAMPAARAGSPPMAWSSPLAPAAAARGGRRSPSRCSACSARRRTRLVAQILAAVVGAAFVIGMQVARDPLLRHAVAPRRAAIAPATCSPWRPNWTARCGWPARALLGDLSALAARAGGSITPPRPSPSRLFAAAFARARASPPPASAPARAGAGAPTRFRPFRAAATLRAQGMDAAAARSLAALADADAAPLPAAAGAAAVAQFRRRRRRPCSSCRCWSWPPGQLAGGLAWLAISGEDAPDLVASRRSRLAIRHAKIEAVMGAIALIFAPFLVALAFASLAPRRRRRYRLRDGLGDPDPALVPNAQANRSHFRRRQSPRASPPSRRRSPRSAGPAPPGLAAIGTWLAAIAALFALFILAGARAVSPRKASQ